MSSSSHYSSAQIHHCLHSLSTLSQIYLWWAYSQHCQARFLFISTYCWLRCFFWYLECLKERYKVTSVEWAKEGLPTILYSNKAKNTGKIVKINFFRTLDIIQNLQQSKELFMQEKWLKLNKKNQLSGTLTCIIFVTFSPMPCILEA